MRLNKDTKSIIVANAVNKVTEPFQAELKTEENAIAEAIFDAIYPAKIVAKMNALPAEFFSQDSRVWVHRGGKDTVCFNLKSSRKISALDNNNWKTPQLASTECDSSLKERVERYLTDAAALTDKQNALKEKMTAFIGGFSSTERLVKDWPEGHEYYKEFVGTALHNPLAVSAAAINCLIEGIKNPDTVSV